MRSVLHPYQVLLVASVILVMAASSMASAEKSVVVTYTPETLVVHDTAPTLDVTAYAIFDVATGKVLVAENADKVVPIASVTKLLTAATVLRTIDRDDVYTILEADLTAHGRAGRLNAGETYDAHELLFPLLLESSNDAAMVYERETEGDIIRRMNGYARELGANTLQVADASGLSDQNRASANDLTALTTALYKNEPHLFDIARLSKRAGPYNVWMNNNPVRDETYQGGKHGFTEAADRTLVAIFEESFSSGTKAVGYVLLGSSDLARDTAILRSFVTDHVTLQ